MGRTVARVICLLAAATVLGAGLQRPAVSAQAGTEQRVYLAIVRQGPERIAFISYRDGHRSLYTMLPDGSGLRYIAPAASSPRWSPDRSRIAFECAFAREICLVQADGSGLRALTTSWMGYHSPAWSPDGTAIAYVSEADGNREIYVVDVERGVATNLTRDPAEDTQPDWSPDGERIAFVSDRSGVHSVYTMQTDGSDVRRLTAGEGGDPGPAWSPDGTRLAFGRGQQGIYLVDREGLDETQIVDWCPSGGPMWSPDGTAIAYRVHEIVYKCSQIAIVSDGGPDEGWTASGGVGGCGLWEFVGPMAWSPDSTQIAYVSGADRSIHVRTLGPDRADRRITSHTGQDHALAWATR